MKNINYKYNPDTLEYEEVKLTLWDRTKKLSYYLIASVVFSFLILSIAFYNIRNYIQKEAAKENQSLRQEISSFNKDLSLILEVLGDIQLRDDNIYRAIFETDPYPDYKRQLGTGGNSMKYKKYENMEYGDLVIEISKKIELIEKKLASQSKSFDEVFDLTKEKQKMIKSIPSIQPVSNRDLTRIASGFGLRMHPIYKIIKMHKGMDFTAPIGTEIYATGDGIVEKVGWVGGYGRTIMINHGFGYKTRYAHCSKYNCRKGQKVKRGDLIGFVGNTGQSSGPHLHYEVFKNNRQINPVNFFFNDLSPEEYDKVIEISSRPNQSL
ncbi:M23 family metallopeptidase [Bacteroidota bacterium]|mgnify:FL=1|nr:peptidase M23 [Crocinitomicaceae bacterium]MDA9714997.1 M23 family metallopeptidase [Bacteroidota bacterium]MEC7526510.1 M23 family metallopeptidase [Bacteroidota bacterium]MEC7945466.1 M23 family metallopeptidase [Bacteroidota bacterium]MEC8030636.1 M23 family metallopeptidase [Bacteroidota bacterium]